MATNTTNYNFKKPDESDFYSIQDQNGNWDKADAALKDLDTPNFEDYSGSTAVPDAATAIGNIKSKGKLSTILSNIKAAFRGVCLIGNIVNNCVSSDTNKPLAAAQGKVLMDLYNVLNTNLDDRNAVDDLQAVADVGLYTRRIVRCNSDTANTPYKAGLTGAGYGTAYIGMISVNSGTILYVCDSFPRAFLRAKDGGNWGDWVQINTKADLQMGNTPLGNCAAGNTTDFEITFPQPFFTTPRVIVSLRSSSTSKDYGLLTAYPVSISKTGFTFRVANAGTSQMTPGGTWIAMS